MVRVLQLVCTTNFTMYSILLLFVIVVSTCIPTIDAAVNLTVDKDQYVIGDEINVLATGITSNDNSQDGIFVLLLCDNIATFTPSTNLYIFDRFGTYFNNNTSATSTILIDWNEVVPISRNGNTFRNKTDVTVFNFTPKPIVNLQFCVVLTNDAFTKVVAFSKPFTLGLQEEIIQLQPSYYSGEYFFLNSTDTLGADYFKVFCLNSTIHDTVIGFKNDPFKFNTVPFRFYDLSFNEYLVDWRRPGFYQIATFISSNNFLLANAEVIKGISNVFEIKAQDVTSKTIVRTNVLNYYPGELINLTVSRLAGTPFNREIDFRLVPANATTVQDYELSFSLEQLMKRDRAVWTSNTTTMIFQPKIRLLQSGLYKMAVYLDRTYRLGVSNIFKVRRGLISITMPKREYAIGEQVSINLFNPLFNFDAYDNEPGEGYQFAAAVILNNNNTVTTYANNIIRIVGNNPTSFVITNNYKKGLYYRLVVNQFSRFGVANQIVLSIPNTTFRVI